MHNEELHDFYPPPVLLGLSYHADEMGRLHGMSGREEKCIGNFKEKT